MSFFFLSSSSNIGTMVSLKVSIIIIIWCTTWNLLVQFLPCFGTPSSTKNPSSIQQWVYQIWWSDSDGFANQIEFGNRVSPTFPEIHPSSFCLAFPFAYWIDILWSQVCVFFTWSPVHRRCTFSVTGIANVYSFPCNLCVALTNLNVSGMVKMDKTVPELIWFCQQMGWNRRNASARMAHTRKTVIPWD